MPEEEAKLFNSFFNAYIASLKFSFDPKLIHPPSPAAVLPYESIEPCPKDQALRHELLQKVVICKLNGGLGTTMGCRGPKSAIEVRSQLTFLDLTVRQVEVLNSQDSFEPC